MGLIGTPSPARLTTDEMTKEQFRVFREGWIRYESIKLMRDGVNESLAKRTAEDEFVYHEKKGFLDRNGAVLKNREIRRQVSFRNSP